MRLKDADDLESRLRVSAAELDTTIYTAPSSQINGLYREFIRIIRQSPTIDPPQWILCDEQLPDKKGYYLTSDRFGVTITQWNGRGWVRTSVVTITEYGRSVHHEPPIVAWMPLPKPYGR